MGQNLLFSKYRVMTPRWKGFGMEITNFEKNFENFHIGPIFGPKRCPIWPKMGQNRHFSKYRVMTPCWKGFGMEITNFEKILKIFISGPHLGLKGA